VILDYDQGRSNRNAFVFPEIGADAFFDYTAFPAGGEATTAVGYLFGRLLYLPCAS
jgi:hypothetical protein